MKLCFLKLLLTRILTNFWKQQEFHWFTTNFNWNLQLLRTSFLRYSDNSLFSSTFSKKQVTYENFNQSPSANNWGASMQTEAKKIITNTLPNWRCLNCRLNGRFRKIKLKIFDCSIYFVFLDEEKFKEVFIYSQFWTAVNNKRSWFEFCVSKLMGI